MKGIIAIVAFLMTAGLTACEKEGPLERAGENVDEAIEKAADKLEPNEGPAEKAGEKIDEAVEKLGEKIEETGDDIKKKTQR